MRNLLTGKEQRLDSVADFDFDEKGTVLIVKESATKNNRKEERLLWVDLETNKITVIWTSGNDDNISVSRYSLDKTGKQIIFSTQKKDQPPMQNSIWYYKPGMEQAIVKVTDQTLGIASGLFVSTNSNFNLNGNYIFFTLEPFSTNREPIADAVQVDVWNYKDSVMQSSQLLAGKPPLFWSEAESFAAVINVTGNRVIQLEQHEEKIFGFQTTADGWIVVGDKANVHVDYWWKDYAKKSYYLVSLKDGSRTLLNKNLDRISRCFFSPAGKYLVYFDEKSYYSYDLASGRTLNISKIYSCFFASGRHYQFTSGWLVTK